MFDFKIQSSVYKNDKSLGQTAIWLEDKSFALAGETGMIKHIGQRTDSFVKPFE